MPKVTGKPIHLTIQRHKISGNETWSACGMRYNGFSDSQRWLVTERRKNVTCKHCLARSGAAPQEGGNE